MILSENWKQRLAKMINTFRVVITVGQNEGDFSDFDQVDNGGTGYVVNDAIVLSNGARLLVTAVGGSGEVADFVVVKGGLIESDLGFSQTLTQASTTGSGTDFELEVEQTNVQPLITNASEAKLEKFFQKHKPTFAQTLALGQAVEKQDLVTVQNIMKSVSAVTEADNPFAAARTSATVARPVQPTRPVNNQVSVKREPQDLQPGDRVKIDDLGGAQVEVEIQDKRNNNNMLNIKTADGRVRQVATSDVVGETTTAGAIASSVVYTGPVIKRRPTRKMPNESSQPRSKKS